MKTDTQRGVVFRFPVAGKYRPRAHTKQVQIQGREETNKDRPVKLDAAQANLRDSSQSQGVNMNYGQFWRAFEKDTSRGELPSINTYQLGVYKAAICIYKFLHIQLHVRSLLRMLPKFLPQLLIPVVPLFAEIFSLASHPISTDGCIEKARPQILGALILSD